MCLYQWNTNRETGKSPSLVDNANNIRLFFCTRYAVVDHYASGISTSSVRVRMSRVIYFLDNFTILNSLLQASKNILRIGFIVAVKSFVYHIAGLDIHQALCFPRHRSLRRTDIGRNLVLCNFTKRTIKLESLTRTIKALQYLLSCMNVSGWSSYLHHLSHIDKYRLCYPRCTKHNLCQVIIGWVRLRMQLLTLLVFVLPHNLKCAPDKG